MVTGADSGLSTYPCSDVRQVSCPRPGMARTPSLRPIPKRAKVGHKVGRNTRQRPACDWLIEYRPPLQLHPHPLGKPHGRLDAMLPAEIGETAGSSTVNVAALAR